MSTHRQTFRTTKPYTTNLQLPYVELFRLLRIAFVFAGVSYAIGYLAPVIYALTDLWVSTDPLGRRVDAYDSFQRYLTWASAASLGVAAVALSLASRRSLRSNVSERWVVFDGATIVASRAAALSTLTFVIMVSASAFRSSNSESSDTTNAVALVASYGTVADGAVNALSWFASLHQVLLLIAWLCFMFGLSIVLSDAGERMLSRRLRTYAVWVPIIGVLFTVIEALICYPYAWGPSDFPVVLQPTILISAVAGVVVVVVTLDASRLLDHARDRLTGAWMRENISLR